MMKKFEKAMEHIVGASTLCPTSIDEWRETIEKLHTLFGDEALYYIRANCIGYSSAYTLPLLNEEGVTIGVSGMVTTDEGDTEHVFNVYFNPEMDIEYF